MRVPVPKPPPQHMVTSPHWPSVRSLDELIGSFKGAQSARKSIADHCLSLVAGLQQVHSLREELRIAMRCWQGWLTNDRSGLSLVLGAPDHAQKHRRSDHPGDPQGREPARGQHGEEHDQRDRHARSVPKADKLASASRSDSISPSCQSSQALTTHAPDSTLSTPPRGCLRSVDELGDTALTRGSADCKQPLLGWFGDLPSCCL